MLVETVQTSGQLGVNDQELIDAALKSLPAAFGDAEAHFMEGKIHRWLSSVNALPGGLPVRDVMTNHRPEPKEHPGIVVVGDYLFDSTLNGLLDSSDAATDIILTEMMRLRRARAQQGEVSSDKIDRSYFENYRGVGPYNEVWGRFTDPAYLTDLIKIVWNRARGYRLLVAGSASGELVGALRERGIDAWGIENNKAIHAKTPKALKKYNKLGSIVDMPFKDDEFDFVVVESLHHLHPSLAAGIKEIARILRSGGRLILWEPAAGSLLDLARKVWYRLDPKHFLDNEKSICVKDVLKAADGQFEPIEIRYGGNFGYMFVASSMHWRIPPKVVGLYASLLMLLEHALNRVQPRQLACWVLAHLRKR
jgi:SAM-dependent methyltransferase